MSRRSALATSLGLGIVIALALAARADEDAFLEKRARDVGAFFKAEAAKYDDVFSADFLAEVPPARMAAIFTSYHQTAGACTRISVASRDGAWKGQIDLFFEKGYRVSATLVIDSNEPHRVTGLLLGAPVRLARTLDDVVKELRALPGKASLALVRLEPARATPIAELAPDEPLAIGSAFKLYVLAELCREVEAGRHRWDEVVPLKDEARSLPSGQLHEWPAGAPVTLHTLAALMISRSDNTATDELIAFLGRDKVESALAEAGCKIPQRNVPFLTTVEMFKIKGDPSGAAAKKFLARDAQGRRAFLDGDVAKMRRDAIQFPSKPTHVDAIEWFFSAGDLCRVMDWLRRHTESGPAAPARAILAINRGLALSERTWRFVGYKGGSEPGVIDMTFLLRSAGGDWFALSCAWNDASAPVDEARFAGLVTRLAELVPVSY